MPPPFEKAAYRLWEGGLFSDEGQVPLSMPLTTSLSRMLVISALMPCLMHFAL